METKQNFKNTNIDSKTLFELFQTKKVDEIATYTELKSVCLKKEDEYFRGSIARALKQLRNIGIVFHNVRNVGYKRANSTEIVNKAPKFLQSARRKLTTSVSELEAVDNEKLTNEELIKKNTYYAAHNLILYIAKTKQIKALEQNVRYVDKGFSFDPKESLAYLTNS